MASITVRQCVQALGVSDEDYAAKATRGKWKKADAMRVIKHMNKLNSRKRGVRVQFTTCYNNVQRVFRLLNKGGCSSRSGSQGRQLSVLDDEKELLIVSNEPEQKMDSSDEENFDVSMTSIDGESDDKRRIEFLEQKLAEAEARAEAAELNFLSPRFKLRYIG